MSNPPRHPQAEPARVGTTLPGALPDAQAAGQRAYHAQRLARLFRLNSVRADDSYLLDLVSRHRRLDPP